MNVDFFRLSLLSGDRLQPEIRLRSLAIQVEAREENHASTFYYSGPIFESKLLMHNLKVRKNFNNVRGISLGIRPIWGINSFTLQHLFDPTMFYRMGSFLYLPRGLETPIQKEQGRSWDILKRTPMGYNDPVLLAWLEHFFTSNRYH